MNRPLITVAICTRNRAALLEKAMRSVLAQANDRVELLVIDNGSTDETAGVVERSAAADPRVKFFVEPETGLSRARNTALKNAKGEWVIFFDDDAEAEPGWLAAYEKFFADPSRKQAAVVGGAVVPEYEIPPPKWMETEGGLELGPKPFCFKRGESPWECNCGYRRDAALQVGGFDARLGHCGDAAGSREGADLNIRLQDAGYEIWWLPGASIRHLVHAGRLNLRWVLHAAFNKGRAVAIQRLKYRVGSGARRSYIAGRLLIAPFHCGINLLVALVGFPFQNGRVTVTALTRAASIAGLADGLLRQF
jgi:glycosyltransferase involved in cell wall biosynthesis